MLPLRAQVATVEVSRLYDVNLDGIRKPAIPTSVDDSLQHFDVHFDYSIFNRPYGDLYDFTPYESIQLSTVGANRTPYVYTRLGAQYAPADKGLLPAGEIYIQSKPRKGFCSGLYGRHNSFFGDLGRGFGEFPILGTSRMENTVGGDITYDWSTGELMFDVRYDLDNYVYTAKDNGAPTISPWPEGYFPKARHHDDGFRAAFNLNSAQKEENTIYYDVTLAYRRLRKYFEMEGTYSPLAGRDSLTEGLLTVGGYVGATFEKHRIYVDMNIEYASYAGVHDFNVGVVEFSPIYQLHRRWLDARLGVKFGSRYGIAGQIPEPGLDLHARSSIFPDTDIRVTLIDKSLWAHAVITGGNDLNPYSRLMEDCPIALPTSTMAFGSRPLDATFSLEGVVSGRLGINLEAIYKIYRNKMIFIPAYDGTAMTQMMASYRNVNQFSSQVEMFWRSQEITVSGRLRYARYMDRDSKSIVTEMPAWTGNASIRYNFRERLIAQVECYYRSATGGNMGLHDALQGSHAVPTYEVPPIVDLDFNVNYLINKHFSVFAKVGNALDHRNQYMPLYLEPGRNFGGGICLNF